MNEEKRVLNILEKGNEGLDNILDMLQGLEGDLNEKGFN